MKKCLFEGICHGDHGAHHHAGSHALGMHSHDHGHHHHHHHHHRALHLFNEIVGPKWRQVERVMGQLHCPELSHTQWQVIRAEISALGANKHHKPSVKHALHHFYHEMGIQHGALHNPYVVFGPVVAQKIKELKLELCRMKTTLLHKSDALHQQSLFNEAFHLAFAHMARLLNDLHASDLTVKRLEHIKHEVEEVTHVIHQCKHHFYNHVGGFGKHIDAGVVGMAEGLKMQWHRVKESLHQRELEIARA